MTSTLRQESNSKLLRHIIKFTEHDREGRRTTKIEEKDLKVINPIIESMIPCTKCDKESKLFNRDKQLMLTIIINIALKWKWNKQASDMLPLKASQAGLLSIMHGNAL